MGQHVVLNNIDHHDLRLVNRYAASLGDGINQVLIFPSEYGEIQRHYPIFFRKTEAGDFKSVALLGFDKDENLFLGDGRWDASYVPAMRKISPFMIGEPRAAPGQSLPADAEIMILVDTENARISRHEGDALFLPHGGQSPALLEVQHVIQKVYAGSKMSDHMFACFHETGLITPIEIDVKLDDHTAYLLKDFFTLSQEGFHNLDGDQLAYLNRTGFLTLAVHALSSLANISHLIDRKHRQARGSQSA